jgi:predicted transposase/invertase (TIGR01784 family)
MKYNDFCVICTLTYFVHLKRPQTTMKQRYCNPFTDFGFKKLFGVEAHKDLLLDFLNALLPPKHRIRNLEYTKNEATGATQLDRKAIFDIACTGENGERFIVELHKAKQNFFKERSVFYATYPIREQAERGDVWDVELAAVYCIGILDFVFDEDRDNADYLHFVQLKNQHNRVFYDKLTFVYLEMPKFTKTEAELATQTDKWLYFLRHVSRLDGIPPVLHEQIFEEAFRAAEIAQFNQGEAREYEASLKYYRDLQNVMNTAIQEAVTKAVAEAVSKDTGRRARKSARRKTHYCPQFR